MEAIVVSYPTTKPTDANDLIEVIQSVLPKEREFVLIAESFSGPLALRIAGSHPKGMIALVLCASFATAPISRVTCWLLYFVAQVTHGWNIPRFILRWCLTGENCDETLVKVRAALQRLTRQALASRFKVLVQFTRQFNLRSIKVPMLYLRPTQDRLVRQKDLALLRSIYPGLVVEELRAPHLILQCSTMQAIAAIERFINRQ